jgi:hypothetical protein
MLKWCAMHIINLGWDLWILGSTFRTLIDDYDVWGPGSADERLLTAWLEFKAWCRHHKWQIFACTNIYICILYFPKNIYNKADL